MPFELKGGVISPSHLSCQTCPWAPDCQFDQKRRGAFKGHGPKYIGYRLITDRVEQNGAKEDTGTCFNFIESGLQKRMSVGRNLREDGKDGEIVKIVAMEEEGPDGWRTYVNKSVNVGFNLKGEIVKPQPHLIEHFKKAGFKVSTEMGTVAVEWRDVAFREPVPKFAEESMRVGSYKQSILESEMNEQNATEDAEDAAWELIQAKEKEREAVAETGGKK